MVLPLHMILPDPLSMPTESTGVGIVQAWMVFPATRRRIWRIAAMRRNSVTWWTNRQTTAWTPCRIQTMFPTPAWVILMRPCHSLSMGNFRVTHGWWPAPGKRNRNTNKQTNKKWQHFPQTLFIKWCRLYIYVVMCTYKDAFLQDFSTKDVLTFLNKLSDAWEGYGMWWSAHIYASLHCACLYASQVWILIV